MSKISVLDVVEIDGVLYTIDKSDKKSMKKLYSAMIGTIIATLPSTALAASDDTFNRIWKSLMTGLDYMAMMVIVFTGVSWMLGHRTKAIELLIAVACGFILARHAPEIVDFLKSI